MAPELAPSTSSSARDGGAPAPTATGDEPTPGGGVCKGALYAPNDALCYGGDGCLLVTCAANDDTVALSWTCDGVITPQSPCGVQPRDYDGCIQWSCGANGQWRGAWSCVDDAACPLDGKNHGSQDDACYCDPKKGGWVCTPNVCGASADGGADG